MEEDPEAPLEAEERQGTSTRTSLSSLKKEPEEEAKPEEEDPALEGDEATREEGEEEELQVEGES